jgi:hypothetical protein
MHQRFYEKQKLDFNGNRLLSWVLMMMLGSGGIFSAKKMCVSREKVRNKMSWCGTKVGMEAECLNFDKFVGSQVRWF